jgi:hypothetical protein
MRPEGGVGSERVAEASWIPRIKRQEEFASQRLNNLGL